MITRSVSGLRSKIKRVIIIDSYDLDTIEEAFDVALKINLTFKKLVNNNAQCSKCERYGHYDYQCLSKSRQVITISSEDLDDSKVIENLDVLFKTTSIIEDISVGSDTLIFYEDHASNEGTSKVVDARVGSGTPLTIDAYVHDTSFFAPELVESTASSQSLGIHLPHFFYRG